MNHTTRFTLGAGAALILAAAAPASAQQAAQSSSQAPAPPARPTPCLDDARFAEFDFWVGDWDVHMPDGTYAGRNSIEKLENGCVLIERWTGAQGGSGLSINYFDERAGEWVQVWSGSGGSQIRMAGGIADGSMVLNGYLHYVGRDQGATFRGTWTPLDDGRVRQFFETSDDGGETWKPWFDGYYSRMDTE